VTTIQAPTAIAPPTPVASGLWAIEVADPGPVTPVAEHNTARWHIVDRATGQVTKTVAAPVAGAVEVQKFEAALRADLVALSPWEFSVSWGFRASQDY